MRFDPKISAIKERAYISILNMDALHGIPTSYEMRMDQDNPPRKEAYFKESKKTKKNKQKAKSNYSCNNDSKEDQEMANFVRKLKRGSNKYTCMFTLKCFNYGKIGHLDSKCPHDNNSDSDEEYVPKKENKYQKGNKKGDKKKVFKKSLYSRKDNSSSDDDDDSDNESERVLFMEMETHKGNDKDYE
jgi:hypothetical protein